MKNLTEKTSKTEYTVPVIEIEGELAFEFPDDLIKVLDLSVGCTLQYIPVKDGEYLLKVIKP